jgi:hypothetical protein
MDAYDELQTGTLPDPAGGGVKNVRRFAIGLVIACSAAIVIAEALPTVTFENFSQGSPNGQFGWKSTGSDGINPFNCDGHQNYDHMIAPNVTRFASFGRQSLRISNAVTSNCLQDQTFSAPVVNEAGETTAFDPNVPRGVRQRTFMFAFDLASTLPASHQQDLQAIASADNGSGGRMSWVRVEDAAGGLQVVFADYQDRPPYGSEDNPENGIGPEDGFFFTTVASGLDRAAKHRVRMDHSFEEGPHNDVVILNVDEGRFVHRGTSWEDFYRWAQPAVVPGQPKPVRESRVARSILFHSRGVAAPNTRGFGFEFDNVDQASGPILVGPPSDKDECKEGGFRTFNNPSFRNQGECVSNVDAHDGEGAEAIATTDRDHDRDNDHRDDDHRDNHDRDDRRDRRP